jgi:hypothetical protein
MHEELILIHRGSCLIYTRNEVYSCLHIQEVVAYKLLLQEIHEERHCAHLAGVNFTPVKKQETSQVELLLP